MENGMEMPSLSRRIRSLTGVLRTVIDRALDRVCVALLIVMTAVTVVQVFFRYVLNASMSWPEEISRWVFVWMIFLGMAVAIREEAHIRIDMLLLLLPPRVRAALEFLLHALTVTACVALADNGWDLASRTVSYSPALQWPTTYEYAALPVGAAFSLYYLLLQAGSKWRSRWLAAACLALGVATYYVLEMNAGQLLAPFSTGTILLVVGLGLLLIGLPVAFSILLASYLAFWPKGPLQTLAAASSLVNGVDAFVLLAIPFFVMAGELMNEGGITMALIRLADTLVGHIRGGLGHVNIVTNTIMAGLSGSSAADAAGTGKILIPAMTKQGYDPAFACGLTAAASVLANIIPPSITMLIYAPLASVSVGTLFMAGYIPGLIMCGFLMITCYYLARKYGYGANRKRASLAEIGVALRRSLWALGMPAIIVVGIRGGVFTATEAASVAAVYSLVVGFVVYKGLKWREMPGRFRDVMLQTVSIMLIIGASSPFAYLLVIEQIPQMIARQFSDLASNPVLLMMLMNLFLLIVGLPLEPNPALVILVPILLPIIQAAGISPVHFGVVMIVNLMIGSLTPPVGVLIFVTAGVSNTPAHRIFWKVLPFEAALIAALLLITYFPFTTLWLPRVITGR